MKKMSLTPVAAALGTTFAVTLAASPLVNAANPFSMTDLGSGYMVADSHEGKCGEGKCGAKKSEEGKCGGSEESAKSEEGKCGEGKCGEKKSEEGKCGESK